MRNLLILLLLLVPTGASAELNSGDVIASKYVCKTPYYLVQYENVKTDKEAVELYNTSMESGECLYSDIRYLHILRNRIHTYIGLEGLSEIWSTRQGIFVIVHVEVKQFKV